jgi:hypothetical protein
LTSKRENGISTYADRLRILSKALSGDRSLRTTKDIGIIPDNFIHLLKETYGKSDHRMLNAKYRYKKISTELSLKIRDQSIFLLKRINSASTISILNTKRSSGLPASSLPLRLYPNQIPTGLDPRMSIQKVGTHKAMDASEFLLCSMRRSIVTRITQSISATCGGIGSTNQKDPI